MITFDFDYYRPDSIEEAINAYRELNSQGKNVVYYAGGTEIISLARVNHARFDAVIDLKGIPECNTIELRSGKLVIGAAVSLVEVSDSNLFPLLTSVLRRLADHTARNKITLGGNICGETPYKEAVLPLLLADSEVTIADEAGMKTLPLAQAFNKKMMLRSGEFMVQVTVDKYYTTLPYANIKRTRQGNMGYPLVTMAAIEDKKRIKVAFSGVCGFPFRLHEIGDNINNEAISLDERVSNVAKLLPAPLLSDTLGSAKYREFVMHNALSEIIEKLGGMK